MCGVGRAESHTEWDNLFLKKLSQGAGAIELMVDVLPAGVPRIACLAYRRLPCKSRARLGVQGGCATQRQNHEGTVAFDLVPGFAPPEELAAEADVFSLRGCCS